MKKVIIFLALNIIVFSLLSCTKTPQKEVDDQLIIDYIAQNKMDAIKTETGLYYQILEEGNGVSPTIINSVTVHYKGMLLDGTVFDSTDGSDPASFSLSKVILGWQEGLELMHEGGEAILIIPSHLGYGSQARTGIPANSVLVFHVDLITVF